MLAIATFITIYSLMLIDSVYITPFNIHTIIKIHILSRISTVEAKNQQTISVKGQIINVRLGGSHIPCPKYSVLTL